MKLATLKDGTRDGTLIVVSRDLKHAIKADDIAPTLQAALDDWDYASPQLTDRYDALNRAPGNRAFEFEPKQCASPLPRAYQWADGSAYISHVERLRKARGAEMPKSFRSDPLMYQGGSDAFLGPCDDIPLESEESGLDVEAEIAVITGDVPMGIPKKEAGDHIRLLMLVNDLSLRNLAPAELAKGFGFLQSEEDPAIKQFVAHLAIERLDIAVLPRATRFDHGLNKLSRATTKYYRSAAELYKDKHYHTVLPFGKTFS